MLFDSEFGFRDYFYCTKRLYTRTEIARRRPILPGVGFLSSSAFGCCLRRLPLLRVLLLLQLGVLLARSIGTAMPSRRQIPYNRLPTYEDDYDVGGNDRRFDYAPKSFDRVPWKSIVLALFLLFLGCLLLLLSYFIFTGHMGGDHSQAYGLLGLGFLTFLPGFYETRLAYYAWRGAQGYRFASIPDY